MRFRRTASTPAERVLVGAAYAGDVHPLAFALPPRGVATAGRQTQCSWNPGDGGVNDARAVTPGLVVGSRAGGSQAYSPMGKGAAEGTGDSDSARRGGPAS
jgi:hypothetical protein